MNARHRTGRSLGPAALVLAASLLAGCTSLHLGQPLEGQASDWSTEGGDAGRTRASGDPLAPPLEEAWLYNAQAGFASGSPLVSGGFVFTATRRGELHAIDLDDGRRRGVAEFGESIEGAPVLTDRIAVVPNAWGRTVLTAYDFVEGRKLWTARGAPVEAGLLLLGDRVIAADVEGTVRAFDLLTGEERWRHEPDSVASVLAAPVAAGPDRIAVADELGRLTLLRASDGAVVWTRDLGAPVHENPAASGGTLYVPTTRGRFLAVDAADGALRWQLEAESPLVRFSAPALAADQLVFGGTDGRLRSVDAATGAAGWSFERDANFSAAPLIAGGYVFAGALDQKLYALDARDGRLLWDTELKGRIKSAPSLSRGTLIVLAEPKYVYAFKQATPELAGGSR